MPQRKPCSALLYIKIDDSLPVCERKVKPAPTIGQAWVKANHIAVAAQAGKPVDYVCPRHSNAGGVKSLGGISVVVIKVEAGGIAEEFCRIIHLPQFCRQY